MRKFLLLISFLMLAVTASFAQGVTTSSINGKVVDGN